MSEKIHAAYDFDEDAMGLADFITNNLDETEKETGPVVYVVDQDGRAAQKAEWVIETLTDGSKASKLRICF